ASPRVECGQAFAGTGCADRWQIRRTPGGSGAAPDRARGKALRGLADLDPGRRGHQRARGCGSRPGAVSPEDVRAADRSTAEAVSAKKRSEERRVGKECRSRWARYT